MRYVGKIHVLDILDTVVVSGYVHAHDSLDGWSPDVWEFSYVTPSYGENDPLDWLTRALYSMLSQMRQEDLQATWRPSADGGPDTISGMPDSGQQPVG